MEKKVEDLGLRSVGSAGFSNWYVTIGQQSLKNQAFLLWSVGSRLEETQSNLS